MKPQEIIKLDHEAVAILREGLKILEEHKEHLSIMSIYSKVAEELRKTGHTSEMFKKMEEMREDDNVDLSKETL